MSTILVSDVFGVTPALLEISKKLAACTIVDPYKGEMMAFKNEAEAYSCFMEKVGLDEYLTRLIEVVENIDKTTTLIGFSVGASTIWRLSEKLKNTLVKQAFCYYGSQIRNFTEVQPRFKINIILPKTEVHFDVVALQASLANKSNVNTQRLEYLHGFMNYHSSNYHSDGYTKQLDFLCSLKT